MRLTFVLAGLGAGGAERVISLISSGFIERGHEVEIISFDQTNAPIYHALDARIRLVRLGLPPRLQGTVKGMLSAARRVGALRGELRRSRPDVIVSFLTKINVLTLLASTGLRIPVVVSERNNPSRQGAHPLWNRVLALLYPLAAAIVMQTRASLECLHESVRSRAIVIPNPIAAPTTSNLSTDSPLTLTAVGRLERQKGFDLLIEAFARVANDHPLWTLVIWGEGNERPRLERRIADLNLSSRVKLPGVSQLTGSWISGASAFVLSSRHEGFPNALGEAMAAGLPVAAFDCPFGPADMIDNGVSGLLVADGDVAALATALDGLMADKAFRERLGAAARQSAQRFATPRILERWHALVADVLEERGGRDRSNIAIRVTEAG